MSLIPKIIWQTYKTSYEDMPSYAIDASSSWKIKNPDYQYFYVNDDEAAQFILSEYGQEYFDLFMSCPVGVMRGDMWRYLVIYKYGGVYADIDTICNLPIDDWLDKNSDVFISLENEVHFCQWTFAAKPGSPLIKQVINLMIERLKVLDVTRPSFIHHATGPGVWTDGILSYVERTNVSDLYNKYSEYQQLIRLQGINVAIDASNIFLNSAVRHIFGSLHWTDGNYSQWREVN